MSSAKINLCSSKLAENLANAVSLSSYQTDEKNNLPSCLILHLVDWRHIEDHKTEAIQPSVARTELQWEVDLDMHACLFTHAHMNTIKIGEERLYRLSNSLSATELTALIPDAEAHRCQAWKHLTHHLNIHVNLTDQYSDGSTDPQNDFS